MSGGDGEIGSTTCSRGHVHPPWNTTGILRIAKCESVCGFCQKETKTAANLRKHVAIHIKNEGLDLTIAEGLSGRGRLEMPPLYTVTSRTPSSHSTDEDSSSSSRNLTRSYKKFPGRNHGDAPCPSPVLMSMVPNSQSQNRSHYSHSTTASPSTSSTSSPYLSPSHHSQGHPSIFYQHSLSTRHINALVHDHLHSLPSPTPSLLRNHHLPTRTAWTPISSTEGFRILDICKALSSTSTSSSSSSSPSEDGTSGPLPCYNREILFDEEWQAHMKNVHGVFLLWPETWMKRVEVLDLDAFGGDIGGVNEVLM